MDEYSGLIFTLEHKRGGPAIRASAARKLGELGDVRAVWPLLDQIQDTVDPFAVPVVMAVLEALPRFGANLVEPLDEILGRPEDPRRRYVPRLLFTAVGEAAVPIFLKLMSDADPDVVLNAVTALGATRNPLYAPCLQGIAVDASRTPLVRGIAASALGMTGESAAYDLLAGFLGSQESELVAGAIDGLAELSDPRVVPLFQALLSSQRLDENTTRAVKLALISLTRGSSEL